MSHDFTGESCSVRAVQSVQRNGDPDNDDHGEISVLEKHFSSGKLFVSSSFANSISVKMDFVPFVRSRP